LVDLEFLEKFDDFHPKKLHPIGHISKHPLKNEANINLQLVGSWFKEIMNANLI
jgi:hypothetical protein